MARETVTAIILSAGKGTRMKSRLPKVLHKIAGRPMLGHVLSVVSELPNARSVLVVGPDMEEVATYAKGLAPDTGIAVQAEQLGTAHAALMAQSEISEREGVVLVIFGDTPLMHPETLADMANTCREEADIVVLGFRPTDPAAYGRLVLDEAGRLQKIVEFKDASAPERAITLCNGGAMAVRAEYLFDLLSKVGNDNAAGEFYLPDIVGLARSQGLTCRVQEGEEEEVQGVNSRADLAAAEAVMQRRLRQAAMAGGATLTDPDSVYFSFDTVLGQDVVVGQNVVFGPGVKVADGAMIKPFSHLEGAIVAADAEIGPFARIRPGSSIGTGAKIGNFVETKKAEIEEGAKVSHLSYIGDARVGAHANIGAGTITCNYDGYNKFFTDIGAGAFVGSNSALVAPVKIGDGAYLGSGSVITKDVTPDALAFTRPKQIEKSGWAATFRAKNESPDKNTKD
ncbi:bifunctional UDP-N-acetylglucosamine diphosphorylase/glucosamine-1-phosphate N-acetyltransferase GlmU [Parvibaculum indicum]|uniref:bifunctional UDP-N-acetylglucosamine diphosphorylase/glucosamine-1-phosphate N-acetyltransferase GlmU n=1 Tax=Parvibaculum indicum TaxID=562969 RepID=UPI001421FFEF|nr:bifunctional UDP-N-acetylglucosamine diphosphorylase/glucosamine-1-phosphate N-acetyltransferase GlmU [Parvibaculum indicum]